MCWGQNRPGIVLTHCRHEIGKTNCKGASCWVFLFEIYWGLYEAAECEVQMVTIMVMGTTCLITLIWPTPFWPPKIWGKKTGRHSISYDDTTKVCLRGFGAEYGLNDLPKDKAWWKSMLIAMVGCMQLMKGMIDNAVIPLEIQRQRQRQQEWQGWQCWDAYGEAWEGLGHRQSD